MRAFLLMTLFLFSTNLLAQDCGTLSTEKNREYLQQYQADFLAYGTARNWTRGIQDIPVKFHIVRYDDGTGGMDLAKLDQELQALNEIYRRANIRFIRYDQPNYINDSKFADFNQAQEDMLARPHDVMNVMNVFCIPNVIGFCGYAKYPGKGPESNRIFLTNSCIDNANTFPHEVGHFFGLYHSHGKINLGTTDELVSRVTDKNNNNLADCFETGDQCCDTPADPNFFLYQDYCKEDCEINADYKLFDPTGVAYRPMVENIMSYNPYKKCRNELTVEQLDRVAVVAKKDRASLKVPTGIASSCKKVEGLVEFKMASGLPMPVQCDINLYKFKNNYRNGDEFNFRAKNNSDFPLNLYILNMDTENSVVKVFPYFDHEKPYLGRDEAYCLENNIILDSHRGKEYVCLLFSQKELEIDKIVEQVKRLKGTFTQRLYASLGKKLLPLHHVNYLQGNQIGFSGCLKDGEILPLMLEMNRH